MGMFASARKPVRQGAVETVEGRTDTTRPVARVLATLADQFSNRTTALGHRGAGMIETAAEVVRARPVATVVTIAALAVFIAGVAGFLAYRSRH